MDFLKAAAQAAQEQVNELKLGALELAEDLSGYTEALVKGASASAGGGNSGCKELEFGSGDLGFRLEGTMVVSVVPGSQAARLGIEAGDRLCAVAGYPVPEFSPDDAEGEQKATKLVQKWLKELPRPSMLSFVPVAADDEEEEEVVEEPAGSPSGVSGTAAGALAPGGLGPEEADPRPAGGREAAHAGGLQELRRLAAEWQQQGADADAAQHAAELQALRGELHREQEERRQLASELQKAKHARAQATASLETLKATHQQKVAELQAQLAACRTDTRKALLAASAGEADNFTALEVAEERCRALEEEVTSLREALDSATQQASEASARRVSEVEALSARAVAAEHRAAALEGELRGFAQAHEAELELLRGDRAELELRQAETLRALEARSAEQEAKAARALEEARREVALAQQRVEEYQAEAHAAMAEAAAAAMEAAAARSEARKAAEPLDGDLADQDLEDLEVPFPQPPSPQRGSGAAAKDGDSQILHERIAQLERRCLSLQKRLDARPVVFQMPAAKGAALDDLDFAAPPRRPTWELSAVSVAGPRAGALAVLLYSAVDESLRGITKRLLQRDAFLWLFYAHLVVLYVIAASCYAETTPLSDGSTADISLTQGRPPAPAVTGAG